MSTPNTPRETANERRRRLLAQVRGAERSIDESLLEHSTTAQDEHRRRVNADIEKFLPGVTEDEQTASGAYEPDVANYKKGKPIFHDYVKNEPLRRRMHRTFSMIEPPVTRLSDAGIPDWTDEDEREFRQKENNRQMSPTKVGTGEWADSLSPEQIEDVSGYSEKDLQFLWQSGNLEGLNLEVPIEHNVDDSRDARIHPFNSHGQTDNAGNITAPHEIDIINIRKWGKEHKKEKELTGSDDTEWKQRYEQLLGDIDNTVIPIPSDSSFTVERAELLINNHKKRVKDEWSFWSNPIKPIQNDSHEISTTYSRGSGRRRGSRRTDGPVRRDMRGVAGSFINQNERGAYTSRGSMTHARGGDYSTGRLDTSRLSETQQPESSDTDVLFSYSTPIAWQRDNGTVIVPTQRHSSTTNRHQSSLRRALHDSGYHSPQELANTMLVKAYHVDRHRQTAGNPVAFKHYMPEHGAYEYVRSEEAASEQARQIADEHYEKVQHRQRVNAEIAGRRPLNSRKPFTRAQQRRLEDAGQLRLPMSPNDESTNRYIMEAPISLGYSAQFRGNTN